MQNRFMDQAVLAALMLLANGCIADFAGDFMVRREAQELVKRCSCLHVPESYPRRLLTPVD